MKLQINLKKYILFSLLLMNFSGVQQVGAVGYSMTIQASYLYIDHTYETTWGGTGEYYIYAGCLNKDGNYDFEASYGGSHGGSFYKVYSGTFYSNSKDSDGHYLSSDFVIKWTDNECTPGVDHLILYVREFDSGTYENLIGLKNQKWDIPNEIGSNTWTINNGRSKITLSITIY